MKKLIMIACVVIVLLLCACRHSTADQKSTTTKPGEETQTQPASDEPTNEKQLTEYLDPRLFTRLVEKEENYELYSDENGRGYYYKIYDNTGGQLTEGFGSWRFLGIEKVNDALIMTKTGSGGVLFGAQYYNVESGQVSRMFSTPIGASAQLVAYFEPDETGIKLVVRDIFGDIGVSYEFRDEGFSASVLTIRCQAVFSEDEKTVQVTFPSIVEKDNMITKVFSLTQ